MKTPINSVTSKLYRIPKSRVLFGIWSLLTLALLQAFNANAQIEWQGGTADYDIATNWVGGAVPGAGQNADNSSGVTNVVEINIGDPDWSVNDIRAANGPGSGAYIQFGQTVNLTGWFRLGVAANVTGIYTLDAGTINYGGGNFNVGESGTGIMNINGGSINGSGNFGVPAGENNSGLDTSNPDTTNVLSQAAGIINITGGGQFFVGDGNGPAGSGLGLYDLSGGTNTVNSYFAIGRSGGYGTVNMTGGIINENNSGVFFDVGTGFQGNSPGAIGILNQSGGTINCQAQFLIPEDSPSTGTYNLSGTGVLIVNNWLAIGRGGGTGTLNMNGGAITNTGTASNGTHLTIGSSGTGTLNQTNGSITSVLSTTFLGEGGTGTWNLYGGNATLAVLELCVNSSASSTLNLNGGTLQVSQIESGNQTAFSELNFNGGTLQASGNNANFLSGLTEAFSGPNPAIIDSQSFNITVAQEIDDNGGGLTKIGSGTLALTGPNTYSGITAVNAGTLNVTTGSGVSGNYTVADGAALGVVVQSPNPQLDAQQNFTLGSSTGATLDFNLGNSGNPGSAPLAVANALTVNGRNTINVADGLPQLGQFPLIQFGSIGGSGGFVLGSIPTGVAAVLVTNGNTIALDITGVNLPVWQGLAGGTWDIGGTTNWINGATGLPTFFGNGNAVTFNDTAPGLTTVNITTTVSPNGITLNNNNLSYTFTGSGSISGPGGLTMLGGNSLTIQNTTANSYTGPTVLNAGTLNVASLANGGSPSAIGSSSANPTNLVLAGGTLGYSGPVVSINRGYAADNTNRTVDISSATSLTLSGPVTAASGSGFTVAGSGQLAYANSGLNTLSDILGYNVDEGTVVFGNTGTDDISGSLDVGSSNSVPAVLDITNAVTVNLLTGGDFDVADSHANGTTNVGIVNQSGGILTVLSGYQTWIGNNTNGVATYNLSGGTFDANNWVAIGRANGTGTFNLSGSGALNIVNGNGGNLDIGTSAGIGGDVGTGILNQTGGTLTNTASETWLGEGASGEPASGTWNMSGGTAQLGELHIGVGGTGTSTLNISGSASITESYLLLANYDINTTGNVNVGSVSQPGGTITVNADMNVGGDGFGTLNFVTNGGGMVTVTGTLYLSRFDPTADGTVNLNTGGTLVVSFINNGWAFNQGTNSPTFNPNAFNFNGGTLRAFTGSQYFIQANVNAVVQSGGAIIDDGGNSVWANCTFNDGPGSTAGLTKLGSGTLDLTATNTYTGTTVVSNGTLIANSLAGGVTVESGATLLSANIVAGPVSVATGGTLGGSLTAIGSATFSSTLSLAAGSTTALQVEPANNDQIVGLTGVTYGGSLVVSNISSSPLTAGSQFKLFNSSSPGSGNFSSVTLLPSGTATFNPTTGVLTITSSGALTMSSPSVSGGNLVLSGSGGSSGGTYSVLTATNLLTPLANWTTNVTGVFSSNGAFTNSIPITKTKPAQFFLLKTP
jgi:autotransporter-associated beta strand protein